MNALDVAERHTNRLASDEEFDPSRAIKRQNLDVYSLLRINDMNKIYLCTSGEYDDYTVDAVFDDLSLAEIFHAKFGGIIEERPLKPFKEELLDGQDTYFVRMTYCGDIVEARIDMSLFDADDFSSPAPTRLDINNNMYTRCFAHDRDHAIEIADNRRKMLLAKNTWHVK